MKNEIVELAYNYYLEDYSKLEEPDMMMVTIGPPDKELRKFTFKEFELLIHDHFKCYLDKSMIFLKLEYLING